MFHRPPEFGPVAIKIKTPVSDVTRRCIKSLKGMTRRTPLVDCAFFLFVLAAFFHRIKYGTLIIIKCAYTVYSYDSSSCLVTL